LTAKTAYEYPQKFLKHRERYFTVYRFFAKRHILLTVIPARCAFFNLYPYNECLNEVEYENRKFCVGSSLPCQGRTGYYKECSKNAIEVNHLEKKVEHCRNKRVLASANQKSVNMEDWTVPS